MSCHVLRPPSFRQCPREPSVADGKESDCHPERVSKLLEIADLFRDKYAIFGCVGTVQGFCAFSLNLRSVASCKQVSIALSYAAFALLFGHKPEHHGTMRRIGPCTMDIASQSTNMSMLTGWSLPTAAY
jgi:hypothetical protein